jgi:cytochrome P450
LDKQQKVHDELDRVINDNRVIKYSDKHNLPYLNDDNQHFYCLQEILRLSNIGPQSIPRRTTKEVTVNGLVLEKHTAIIAILSTILLDEEVL